MTRPAAARPGPPGRRHRHGRHHPDRATTSSPTGQPHRREERRRAHHRLRPLGRGGADRGRGEGLRPEGLDRLQGRAPHEPLQPVRRRRGAPGDRRLRARDRRREPRRHRGRGRTPAAAASATWRSASATFLEQGGKRVSPFMVPMLSPSMAACQISIQNGTRGPVVTSVAACASGVQAFVEAQRMIEHGDVDVVIAGGTESAILPVAFAALSNMGALSKRNDDPQAASRPFDADRDGFVFGEGGRRLGRRGARARPGARRHDPRRDRRRRAHRRRLPHHRARPRPGSGAALAMQRALRDAAHGAGARSTTSSPTAPPRRSTTRPRRRRSSAAFGDHADRAGGQLATRAMIGHTLGAAGAMSALAAVLRDPRRPASRRRSTTRPPTRPATSTTCRTRRARAPVDAAIINGFGFGGQNAVAVFRRPG